MRLAKCGMRGPDSASRATAAGPSTIAIPRVPSLGTPDLLRDLGLLLEGELGCQRKGQPGLFGGGGGLTALTGVSVDGPNEALHPPGEPRALVRGVAVVDVPAHDLRRLQRPPVRDSVPAHTRGPRAARVVGPSPPLLLGVVDSATMQLGAPGPVRGALLAWLNAALGTAATAGSLADSWRHCLTHADSFHPIGPFPWLRDAGRLTRPATGTSPCGGKPSSRASSPPPSCPNAAAPSGFDATATSQTPTTRRARHHVHRQRKLGDRRRLTVLGEPRNTPTARHGRTRARATAQTAEPPAGNHNQKPQGGTGTLRKTRLGPV